MAKTDRGYGPLDNHMYMYDLGWLIKKILEFQEELDTAIDLKTIHYADPIQWDITTQYSPNTVVVDPKTGTAYMSKVPVPAGIQLDNTDYWVVIFNYQRIYDKIMSGVAFNDKENLEASKDISKYDFVWFGGDLYQAQRDIPQGSKYVPRVNIVATTIADALATYYGRDRVAQVINDTLTASETQTIGAKNRIISVTGDQTVTAGDIAETSANRTIKTTADYHIDVDGNLSDHVDGVTTVNRGGSVTEAYGSSLDVGVTGTYTADYSGAVTETYKGKRNVTGKDSSETFTGTKSVQADLIKLLSANPIMYSKPVNGRVEFQDTDGSPYFLLTDSTVNSINITDYPIKQDGSDEHAILTQAIADATNSHSSLLIPADVTIAIGDSVIIPDGADIILNGTIKILDTTGAFLTNMDGNPHPVYTGNGNISIRGRGVIDGQGQTRQTGPTPLRLAHGKNIVIQGITLKDIGLYHAVELMGCCDVLINSVKFVNCWNPSGSNNSSVQIEPCASQTGQNGAIPFDSTPCKNITINSCIFTSDDARAPIPTAIESQSQGEIGEYSHDNIVIKNCIFNELSEIEIAPYRWSHCKIVGCYSVNGNNSFIGALVRDNPGMTDSIIALNTISNNREETFLFVPGICDNLLIASNIFDNIAGPLINMRPGCENITITGNIGRNLLLANKTAKAAKYNMMSIPNSIKNASITNNTLLVSVDDTFSNSLTYSGNNGFFRNNMLNMQKDYKPQNSDILHSGTTIYNSTGSGTFTIQNALLNADAVLVNGHYCDFAAGYTFNIPYGDTVKLYPITFNPKTNAFETTLPGTIKIVSLDNIYNRTSFKSIV